MSATTREVNLAEIESRNNENWQKHYDMFLYDKRGYDLIWREYDRLTGDGSLAFFMTRHFPRAILLLHLAMLRFNEEAVRRGILPEQKISESGEE